MNNCCICDKSFACIYWIDTSQDKGYNVCSSCFRERKDSYRWLDKVSQLEQIEDSFIDEDGELFGDSTRAF